MFLPSQFPVPMVVKSKETIERSYHYQPTRRAISQTINCVKCNSKKETPQNTPENISTAEFNAVSIPGLERFFAAPFWRIKILWLLALFSFYGLCVYQLADRIHDYLQHPVALTIIIERPPFIDFPSISVCPSIGNDQNGVMQLLHKKCQSVKHDDWNCSMKELSTTLDVVWEEYVIRPYRITIKSSCPKLKIDGECDNAMVLERRNFFSVLGTCTTIAIGSKLSYHGAHTYIEVTVTDNAPYEPEQDEMLFIPHVIQTNPAHEVLSHSHPAPLLNSYKVDARFQTKKIQFLDTPENPCIDERLAEQCKTECMHKYLLEKMPCRLPFVTSHPDVKTCETVTEVWYAIFHAKSAYREYDSCNCTRKCQETLLMYSYDDHRGVKKTYIDVTFRLSCLNNVVEVIKEKYTYSLSSLVSDIGGSLGFCVGLCLFSFVEIVEKLLQKTIPHWFQA